MAISPDERIDKDAGQRGRRKDEHKGAAILEAAIEMFLAESFDRVSMDAVADKAGVSKATIYSHFSSKNELFVAAIGARCRDVFDSADLLEEAGLPLAEALAAFSVRFVDRICSEEVSALHHLMMAEGARDPDLPRLFYREVVDTSTRQIAALLEKVARRGEIDCPNPYRAAVQLISMIQGDFLYRIQLKLPRASYAEIEDFTKDAVAMFLRAHRRSPA